MNVPLFLKKAGVPFEVIEHAPAYDAQHAAHELHVPGRMLAKTVLLRADRGFTYLVAVLPAERWVDFRKAAKAIGGGSLELAAEAEIAERCPDCERGALPPFGSQYGMKTLLDRSLLSEPWIVFEGNTHHAAIRMRTDDFRKLEQPLLADFALKPSLAGVG